MREYKRVLVAGACSWSVAVGSIVSSEAEAAQQIIEEVVVTAQKRQETLMEVPQSVQAFSGGFLEEKGIYDLVDAVNFVPGASASFSGGSGSQLYNLRGTGAQGRIGQIAIGFYIDGIPYIAGGPYGPPIEFFDLEALEVLRGPQGTLYGQGSMGGTFVITTAEPDLQQIQGRARFYGDTQKSAGDSYGFDATFSTPIVEEKLAFRVTGGYKDNGGLAESPDFPDDDNIDPYENWDVRGKLLWVPNDKLSAEATFWYTDEDRDFSPGIYATVDPPLILGTGGIVGKAIQETQLASLRIDYDLGFADLTSSTSFIRSDGLFDSAFAFDTFIPGAGLVNSILQLTVPADSEVYDEEIRLTSTAEGPFRWTAGGQYSDVQGSSEILSAYVGGFLQGVIPDSVSSNSSTSKRWSVFGEASYELFGGRLTPLVGLRYFEDKQTINSVTSSSPAVVDRSDKFSAVSPRFNLLWRPNDWSQAYINIAKGFRSGLINRPDQQIIAGALGIVLPESLEESTLWSYEVGGRVEFLDRTLRIEPAVYLAVYEDYQFEGSSGNVNFALPIDEVEALGVDLLVTWVPPIEGLSFLVNAGWNTTEPTKIDPAITATQASLAKDEQMPFVPEWSYNLVMDYERPLPFGDLTGFTSVQWFERDDQVDFITGLVSDQIEDLTLRLGVRRDKWAVTLFGQNLTDEKGPAVIAGGLQNRYDRRSIGINVDVQM